MFAPYPARYPGEDRPLSGDRTSASQTQASRPFHPSLTGFSFQLTVPPRVFLEYTHVPRKRKRNESVAPLKPTFRREPDIRAFRIETDTLRGGSRDASLVTTRLSNLLDVVIATPRRRFGQIARKIATATRETLSRKRRLSRTDSKSLRGSSVLFNRQRCPVSFSTSFRRSISSRSFFPNPPEANVRVQGRRILLGTASTRPRAIVKIPLVNL